MKNCVAIYNSNVQTNYFLRNKSKEANAQLLDNVHEPEILNKGKTAGPLSDVTGQRENRVPDVMEPLDYYIRIQPYFPTDTNLTYPDEKNFTFDGITTFKFLLKETANLTLHSLNLNYSEVKLFDAFADQIHCTYSLYEDREQIIIVPAFIEANKTYFLQFKYTGYINHYLDAGLYRTSYTDINDTVHWLVATQMEAFSARTVFPCMDEPAFKAIFHLTLIYPEGYVALGNTMERTPVPFPDPNQKGWMVIQFPPSLRMSTYLVAFAVGHFVKQERMTDDNVLVRVWGWTGQEDYLDFAANVSVSCLKAMTDFTNFTFPMSKSDQLGLPEFVAGAMENYGLIIYKYQFIAIDPKVHTSYDMQAAARVICHELGHQWFGDTVSAAWWDDLFLQEGMAAFFEDYAPHVGLEGEEDFFRAKFLVESFQAGLVSDAVITNDSHSLYYYDGPAFDDTTYLKGSSILWMIEATLGDEIFKEALQNYIHEYKFHNADHFMFFNKLTEAASAHGVKDWCGDPFNATLWLEPWFYQQSFPLLTVKTLEEDFNEIVQEPFNDRSILPINTTELEGKNYNYTWPIPVFRKTFYNDTKLRQWVVPEDYMKNCKNHAIKPSNKRLRWEMYNVDSAAFVRTQYDDVSYAKLLKKLKNEPDHFTYGDKIGLIGDQIAFLNKKKDSGEDYTYERVMDMIEAILPNNAHFGPFQIAQLNFLGTLEKMLIDSSDYGLLQLFMKRLFTDNYKSLGWNYTKNWDEEVTRQLMLPYAVRYDVEDAVDESKSRFDEFLKNCSSAEHGISNCSKIHPDFHLPVYCGGIKAGNNGSFDALLEFYYQETKYNAYFYQEYYSMLQGMSCSKSKEDITRLIYIMLHVYRLPQNKYKLASLPLYFLTVTPGNTVIMAEYLKTNFTLIKQSGNLEEYLSAMTSTWYTKGYLQKYNATYQKVLSTFHLTDVDRELFEKYRDVVTKQADIGDKYLPSIIRFLYDNPNVVTPNKENWPTQLNIFQPSSYELTVKPYVPGSALYPSYKNFTFDGHVVIKGKFNYTTPTFTLNAHRLIIQPEDVSLTILDNPETKCSVIGMTKNYATATLSLSFDNCAFPINTSVSLTIDYKGFVFDVPKKGVYTNTNYYEFNDKKAWIFATYFESGPSARSLLPCFDQPQYKANWTVTLWHPADTTALGNMPVHETILNKNGWAVTNFLPTPPMSSYILSLAAGHFASLQTVSETGVLIRAWAWTGMETYAEHALKTVTGTVDFMSTYFNYSFPLPKLDVLALPQYTTLGGAEEHWGLIHVIYDRELADPRYATASIYMDIASVTAHETVHQWFGDLVTIKNWKEVVLNEGFANYWETNGVMKAHPEQVDYEAFERFRKACVALTYDTNPSRVTPVIPERPSYFTGETYHKGATMLHMLSNTITPPKLKQGLISYIRENAFGNVEEQTLWNSINEAVNETIIGWNNAPLDVSVLMASWMHKKTLPVLKVELVDGKYVYAQQPYLSKEVLNESEDPQWYIPLLSRNIVNGDVKLHYHLPKDNTDSYFSRPKNAPVYVDNVGAKSFVLMWYSDDVWSPIYDSLNSNRNSFDAITRAQFIVDAYYLLLRGSLKWSRLLDIATLLKDEDHYASFYAFKPVMDTLFSLASLVTEYACKIGITECLNTAKTNFDSFITHCQYSTTGTGACNDVSPDFRRTQYCYGLRQNDTNYDFIERLYQWFMQNSKYFTRDTDNLLYALSCSNKAGMYESMLKKIFNGKYPSKAFEYVAANSGGTKMINFLKSNADLLNAPASFSDFITAAAKTCNSKEQMTELEELRTILTAPEDIKALDEAIKTVNETVQWIDETDYDGLASWLKNHQTVSRI